MNTVMKQALVITTFSVAVVLTGCGKSKPEPKSKTDKVETISDWSCTHPDNLNQIQTSLKKEYLKQIERSLRQSEYQVDADILNKINQGLKFEIKNIRTLPLEDDSQKNTQLSCQSQLVISLPKGLQQRAEKAYIEEQRHSNEESGTLNDHFSDNDSPLTLENDQLKGEFFYNITKTDKEGLVFNLPSQNTVIEGVVFVVTKAVQYAAYVKENQLLEETIEENRQISEENNEEQTALAQKAMDVRKKELDSDKAKQVERLNQTWDKLSAEKKTQFKQDQSDWFEKRDVECKVLAQKSVHEISEKDLETYQKQSDYWTADMRKQNQEMQYTQCFIQKTTERTVYLNNLN
ncbi:DUF1311 domain-containing protein [Acinetobacter calcoaceticus]|uniref:lysozyme inhibitor LprI family protein n=1 Tax=Acinetobacter calcoaceticus TaxID=471 RepID=UPI0019007665|nr:lysozyme inhibitor LprI family protein [Acinetobacter calcoaceticus]MBJ9721710.1 DUF1311 domain-containing protein [Acinetobacter calcoaceticus]